MKKVLITGANSYIGTYVEKYLLGRQGAYQVDALDMIDGSWRQKRFDGYDTVYHVAGIAHSDNGKLSEDQKALYYKVNTDLAVETAKKAKAEGVRQFIFMSSAIVYGDSAPIGKQKMITRDTPLTPTNAYGDSKVQAEKGILILSDADFKVVILRPPMIYGPNCKGNYPRLSKLAQKLPIVPYVENRRSMLYVGNLAEFVRLMIENEEQGIFWPQNDEYVNTVRLMCSIADVHGKHLITVKGFQWAFKLLGGFIGAVNKAFGNLCYAPELSTYREVYCLFSSEDSIRETEASKR